MSKKRLFIIDTMAMAFRNYHAIRPLTTSQGLPVNAVFGSLMFLWSLIEREKPDYLAFATDSQEKKTFRHTLYDKYKANRKEMPEDLAAQLPSLFRLFSAFQAPLLKEPGLEADDLIGSLVCQNASDDLHCFIVSGDKDFMQLVNPNVCLYSPKKGNELTIIGREGVFEKFGCTPEQVIDILTLIGDASDNVPGVPGIGEKGAAKLIQEFGSLDNIYENLDKITNKRQRQGLEENRELTYLSRQLVTIKTDCTLDFSIEQLKCNPETALANPDLLTLLQELEFRTYVDKVKNRLKHVPIATLPSAPQGPRNYHLVRTEEELRALDDIVGGTQAMCFDTETTGLDRIADVPIGVSLSVKAGEAFYIPLHPDHRLLDLDTIHGFLRSIFQRRDLLKIGHNTKFDLQMLANIGLQVEGPFWDTMIASHLIDSSERIHNLDACVLRHFHFRKIPTEDILGATGSMLGAPLHNLVEYACEDADYTFRLFEFFAPKIREMELEQVFHEIEMPLVPVIAHMEQDGIFLDVDILSDISNRLAQRAHDLEKEIFQIAGEEFNIASTKQLQTIIFDKLKIHEQLGLTRLKKTKTGYSTDVTVLEQMEEHPMGKALLDYRMVTKLKSTYVDTLPQLIHPKTNRVHTNFNQHGAATGRLSSTDPNLQNIPIRSNEGREIRKAFQAGHQDWLIVSADYSQIELRVLAAMANEANLRDAFAAGEDIHTATAARIFGVDPKEVTPNHRAQAKAINFGIIYGMGPQRLARETGVTVKAAKEFIDRYFATYPGIRAYIDGSIAFAREHEYTKTITGRRRSLREINSNDRMALVNAQNIAVNAPIQGSSADLIKKAMVLVQKKLAETGSRARMLLQVHDELVFECPADEVDSIIPLIKREMEEAFDLGVPLKVEVGVGKNWLEAH